MEPLPFAEPQTSPDPPNAGMPDPSVVHRRARARLLSLQRADGAWEGEMVWNTMILSQYVITRHLLGRPVPDLEHPRILRHFEVTRLRGSGWGLHLASTEPSLYCTALAYTALRLLGRDSGDALCAPALRWLRSRPGGAAAVPTWGKFWLAMLGVYDYRAMHPMPPEIFVLPRWLPLHPDRLYCHTRSLAQSMAFLYGTRFRGPQSPLIRQLRTELFDHPPRHEDRRTLGADTAAPPTRTLRVLQHAMAAYERRPPRRLRRYASDVCRRRTAHEHAVSARIGLSPVNSLLDLLVLHASAEPHDIEASLAVFEYWRWTDDAEGTRYAGARSHTWDTSFAIEALLAEHSSGAAARDAVDRAALFLAAAQVAEEIPEPHRTARSTARGGWCFSEGDHRWPVSDCTAEAVNALLAVPVEDPAADTAAPHPAAGFDAATDFLLSRQNRDGGFGTYEARRAPQLLDCLNPAEMFTRCTVEGSYVECTGSAAVALAALRERTGGARADACDRALLTARDFLLKQQDGGGSWPAAWGVNRIYGTLFAVRGLLAAGVPRTHPRLIKAAWWLEGIQLPDGSWSEDPAGCTRNRYVPGAAGQPVSTAWALLTLLELTGPRSPAVRSGVDWLCTRQQADGSWDQTTATGVFFGTAMLDYRLYREYFPLWALGRWLSLRQQEPAAPHNASGHP